MADLEKLALRRDRGYLIRLMLLIGVGVLVSVFVFGWLTGSRVSGCMADHIGQATRDAAQLAQSTEPRGQLDMRRQAR